MEHYEISKLLNDSTLSKFETKKWVKVKDLSSSQYSVSKNITFKTSMLISNLCDYGNAYITVKGIMSVTSANSANRKNKKLIFKNNAPFTSYITKVNNTFVDNTEVLDIIMPMYNLLDYSGNYTMTSESLWSYYRDEINDDENENDDNRKTKQVNLLSIR